MEKLELELSSQKKGTITEMAVAIYLLQLGYNVSQPFCQDSKYDLIVDVEGKLLRLQVKKARLASSTSITFSCRSTTTNVKNCKSKKYNAEEIDYFATYWNGKAYLVSISECSTQKSLHFERTNRSDWCYLEDYDAKKVLKSL